MQVFFPNGADSKKNISHCGVQKYFQVEHVHSYTTQIATTTGVKDQLILFLWTNRSTTWS